MKSCTQTKYQLVFVIVNHFLDGLDLEVKSDQGKYKTLEILYKVIEASQTVRVLAVVDVDEGSNLRGGERNVLIADDNFQFLSSDAIGLGPGSIVFIHDFRVFDNSSQFVHDGLVNKSLLTDHGVILVIGVVSVTQFAVGSEFKFEKFVAELSLVTDIVSEVEVLTHFQVILASKRSFLSGNY